MIVLSLILVIVAAVALIAGIFQGGLELIYTSIGACVLAMILLGIGVLVRRRSTPRPSAPAYGPGASGSPAAPAGPGGPPATAGRGAPRESAAPEAAPDEGPDEAVVVRRTVARDAPARREVRAGDDEPSSDSSERSAFAGRSGAEPGARRIVRRPAVADERPGVQRPVRKKAVTKRPTAKKAVTRRTTTAAPPRGPGPRTSDDRTTGAAARSALAQIKGVGPAKQEALLHAFSSLEAIRDASLGELSQVQGIGPSVARRVKDALS